MLNLAHLNTPNFTLGRIVMTPGAQELFEQGVDPNPLLQRHCLLDADLDTEDLRANKDAAQNGLRIFSSYDTEHGKLWLITESDRSATTFLTPVEY